MIETVVTQQGRLRGIQTGSGSAFLGIPYAAPPVEELRWRPPQPFPAWEGTRDANRHGPVSLQPLPLSHSLYWPGSSEQSEDCLSLNIWTEAKDGGERRPVMVWFHLGAFLFGSSSWTTAEGKLMFDGENLSREAVVVVTVNYRLGRFGFMAHPWLSQESEHGVSGNYGFLDQVAALEWIKDNIASFGGDPGNVTIFGVSAGSASCSLHMASPLSRGLFHRVIAGSGGFMSAAAQSSGVFDRLLDLTSAEARGLVVTDLLGVKNVEELRALPAAAIISAYPEAEAGPWHMQAVGAHIGEGASDTCYPVVDGHALPDAPGAIIRAGRHNDVPLITGSTLDDRSGLPSIESLSAYDTYLKADMGGLAQDASRAWPAKTDSEASRSSGDLLADRVFGWNNWTWAKLACDHGSQPVYYYDWAFEPPIPEDRYLPGERGATHAAEMPYIFGNLSVYDWAWRETDREMSRRIMRYWVNFAHNGNPNGDGVEDWPQFCTIDKAAMRIDAQPKIATASRQARFAVLDRYYASR
jgi:para-nitrobenzyl esterase